MSDGAFLHRTMLTAPALAMLGSVAACAQGGSNRMKRSKTLVAYLTRSGNTRVIAETLHRELGADLLEIRPARPYPADYEKPSVLASHAPGARIEAPFVMEADQERRTLNRINGWLGPVERSRA